MAKAKYDAVLQAVHYKSNGQVDWVRTFQRRGPIWSDYVLLNRQELVSELKSGKVYVTGRRVPYMAGTFEVEEPVRLLTNGSERIVVGEDNSDHDYLKGVPII